MSDQAGPEQGESTGVQERATLLGDAPLRYLPDEPATVSVVEGLIEPGDVSFAHEHVAQAIADIVQRVPTPYCIGLSGAWGSGKTGIASSVEKILRNSLGPSHGDQKTQLIMHYFDILEHSEDVFRRQLLISMDEALTGGSLDLSKALYQSTSCEVVPFKTQPPRLRDLLTDGLRKHLSGAWEFSVEYLRQIRWRRAMFVGFLFVLLLWVILRIAGPVAPGETLLAVSVTIVVTFLSLMPELLKSITVVRNDEAPRSPEQLDTKFDELLQAIRCGPDRKHLVLILDNLDRCEPTEARKVLAALTTFVKRPGVVAVVPCDVGQVAAAMGTETDGGRDGRGKEFLRKTFDTVVNIPKLSDLDVESFAMQCVQQSTFGALASRESEVRDRVTHILTMGFYEQPRRIKTFVNNMTSRLAVLRSLVGVRTNLACETEGELVSALAWVEVLQERWLGLWRQVEEYPSLLVDLLRVDDLSELTGPIWQGVKIDKAEQSALSAFINNTKSWVRPEHVVPIVNLRSEVETPLAGEEMFIAFLKTGDAGHLEAVTQEELEEHYDAYLQLARRHLEGPRRRLSAEGVLTATRALLKLADRSPKARLPELAGVLLPAFRDEGLRDRLAEIEDERLVSLLAAVGDGEDRNVAEDCLARVAKKRVTSMEPRDKWVVAFAENARRVGKEAQDHLKAVLRNELGGFKDDMGENAELIKTRGLTEVLKLLETNDAIDVVVDKEFAAIQAKRLKPELEDLTAAHVDLQLLLSRVIPGAEKHGGVLRFLTQVATEATSTPAAFGGKVAWVKNQLAKVVTEAVPEDCPPVYECCKQLVAAMQGHELSPIARLLDICLPLYGKAPESDQSWLREQVVNDTCEKKLGLDTVVPAAIAQAAASSYKDPHVQLALAVIEAFAGLELNDDEKAVLYEQTGGVAKKCSAAKPEGIEAVIVKGWLEKDFSKYLENSIWVVQKNRAAKGKRPPAGKLAVLFRTKLDSKTLGAAEFEKVWKVYVGWWPKKVRGLWDVVRNVVEGSDTDKQHFLFGQLGDEGIRAKILKQRFPSLARTIGQRLHADSSLVVENNTLVLMLLDIVPGKAAAGMPQLMDIITLALDGAPPQIDAAARLAMHVCRDIGRKRGMQIIEKLTQRAEEVDSDSGTFTLMKQCAESYAEKFGLPVPEAFIQKTEPPPSNGEGDVSEHPAQG